MTESPRLRLRRLITGFRAGGLYAESFCSQFENTYNMELDKRTLTPDETEAFAALFEQVIWYSLSRTSERRFRTTAAKRTSRAPSNTPLTA